MSGAIAGTAILHAPREPTSKLHTVTVAVNNRCNLQCPHCYLQYESPQSVLSEEHARMILDADFKHLAIVGKEPTLNPEMVEFLVRENNQRGRKTSMITNGILLSRISDETLKKLDYIDVSFDGGLRTYSKKRHYDYQSLIQILHETQQRGAHSVNALHTIYAENIEDIDDMMRIANDFPFNTIAFSPYQIPVNDGTVSVTPCSIPKQILPALAAREPFMQHDNATFLTSPHEMTSKEYALFLRIVNELGLNRKVHCSPDPLTLGFIRVSHDGIVLAPSDSIHPAEYSQRGFSLDYYRSVDAQLNGSVLNYVFGLLLDYSTTAHSPSLV